MQNTKEILKEMFPDLKVHNITVDYLENGNFMHNALQVVDPFNQGDAAVVENIKHEMKAKGLKLGSAIELEGDFTLDELLEVSQSEEMLKYNPRVIYVDREFFALSVADELVKKM